VINEPNPGDVNQQWRYNKERQTIDNNADSNKVFDVAGDSTDEGAEVCAWEYKGTDNQKWEIKPVWVSNLRCR